MKDPKLEKYLTAFAYSPVSNIVAAGSSMNNEIVLLEVPSGRQLHTMLAAGDTHHNPGELESFSFSPDGKTLASSGSNIQLWDVATGRQLRILPSGPVDVVRYSPDGKTIATATGNSETGKLWDVASGRELRAWHLDFPHLISPAGRRDDVFIMQEVFSPDGKSIVCLGSLGAIALIDCASGRQLRTISEPIENGSLVFSDVAISSDGKTIAATTYKGVYLWNTASGQPLPQPELRQLHALEMFSATAFSPSGKIVANGFKGDVFIWDIDSGQVVQRFSQPYSGFSHEIAFVAYSANGQILATASHDSSIYFFDLSKKK